MTITIDKPATDTELPADVTWEPKTFDQLINQLNEFPSAQAIADYFLANGVRGICGNAAKCAIAQWLTDESDDEFERFIVRGTFAYAVGPGWPEGGYTASAPLSQHARCFIDAFDHHGYPQLEK